MFAFLTRILRQYVLWEGGIIDGWLLGLETAEVANRLDWLTTLTEGSVILVRVGKALGAVARLLLHPTNSL